MCDFIIILGLFIPTQTVKNLPARQEIRVWSLGREVPLEKEMAIHSSVLAWRIPRIEQPGGLQSMGSQRVGHDWRRTHTFPLIIPLPWVWFYLFSVFGLLLGLAACSVLEARLPLAAVSWLRDQWLKTSPTLFLFLFPWSWKPTLSQILPSRREFRQNILYSLLLPIFI